jgi:putative transposase
VLVHPPRSAALEALVLAVLHTDLTEFVDATGRAQLVTFVDHTSRVVPGWAISAQGDTELALRSWAPAKRGLRRFGWPIAGIIVHHDQDPVFTGCARTGQLLLKDHARLSYTLDGCRGNTEMESFRRRFKSGDRSLLLDAADLAELIHVVRQRMMSYNYGRRHSSLGNQTPMEFLRGLLPRE